MSDADAFPPHRAPRFTHPATRLAQLNHYADPQTGGLSPAIQLSVTACPGDGPSGVASNYGRSGNSCAHIAESLLADLEGGAGAAVFGSGSAAAQAVLSTLRPGSHILLDTGLYYEFSEMVATFGMRWGMTVTHADFCDTQAITRALRPGMTRLVWAECPSNPLWRIPNLSFLAERAHAAGARLLVDSTVATPLQCRPLHFGADIVLHSATKYLNGHGDVLAGALVTARQDDSWRDILAARTCHGSILPPFEAWLLLRGMRTLALRVRTASASALRIAAMLQHHPRVSTVHYPGLPDDPHHAMARRQFQGGFGAMLSFQLTGSETEALAVRDRTRLFHRATSLGSTESLIEHRRSTEGAGSACPPTLLRLSIGIEEAKDLLADLTQALDA